MYTVESARIQMCLYICMYVWADKFCMFRVGVTYIQADGSYIIATRSLNSEIDAKAKSSKNNGYIRSLVSITPQHIYIHTCMHAFTL